MIASPRGNRSTGYLVGIDIVPSGFSGSFAELFAYSASGLHRYADSYLLPIYMCVFGTNIFAGTYSACGFYHFVVLLLSLQAQSLS